MSEGSPLYEGPHGLLVLPLGHYTVTLEHAPAGFSPVNTVLSFDVMTQDRTEVEPLLNFEPLEETLAVVRGDIMFRKVDEGGMTLAGIPFLLSYANGEGPDLTESHVVVTNEHGDFTSSAERSPHALDTNRSDAAILANIDGVYKLDETKLTSACGTWFSMDATGMTSPADDTRGALPYGSYLLQELPCAANAGTNLISTQFSINRDDFTVKLDNIVNTRPGVSGSATDATDADKLIRPMENAIVSESIDYRNLVIGKSYRVNCSAFVQSTGESVPGPDGTPAFASQEFVAQRQNGKLDIQVTLDTSKLAGENIIVRVELVSDDGMNITSDGADSASRRSASSPSSSQRRRTRQISTTTSWAPMPRSWNASVTTVSSPVNRILQAARSMTRRLETHSGTPRARSSSPIPSSHPMHPRGMSTWSFPSIRPE